MQNKCNNCDAGFVSLSGDWSCGGCGWSNCGCDTCSNCGWNRWGCNNGCNNGCGCNSCSNGCVVSVGETRNNGRSGDGCHKDCQNEGYTRQRNNARRERVYHSRSTDCGCDDDCPVQTRRAAAECCDDNTEIRETSCGCKDSVYTWNRNNDCDKCDECSGAYTRNRSDGCDKCDNDGAYTRSRKNRGVGMVWAAKQELDRVFESESALRTGTLFPELHKPMNGYCPGDCNCQTDEQAAAFAAWELRLYLNTHPDDKQAMALFRKLCEETDEPNYATTFLKDDCCASDWGWTDDPWPWECRPCGK